MAATKKRIKHRSVGGWIWIVVKYFSLIFFSFAAVLPVVSCVITAFKTDAEYQSTNVMTLPAAWTLDNFIKAFNTANMGRAFLNSGIVLVCVLAGAILVGTQLAYVLNRFKFPGNTLIRNLFLFASLLPAVAMQVTVYNIMGALGFINHLYGYIIMSMGTDIISVYIFIQFMENIPDSLDESAIIDGASYFQIYWKIILPLLQPAIVTSAILKGVGTYNEYYAASLYLHEQGYPYHSNVPVHVSRTSRETVYNMICAGVIISLLPALIIFVVCQKQIYSGYYRGSCQRLR